MRRGAVIPEPLRDACTGEVPLRLRPKLTIDWL